MSAGSVTGALLSARYLDVKGIRTRYFDGGSGETLLFVHGDEFGGISSASTWGRNLPELARSFRVVAVDRIGQGFTDNPETDADYTAERVLRHLHEFVDALGLGDLYVVGQSRGSYFAMRFALERGSQVKGLVLADTATLAPGTEAGGDRIGQLLAHPPTEGRAYAEFRWTRLSYTTEHITSAYLDEAGEIARTPKFRYIQSHLQAIRNETFVPSVLKQKTETLRWIKEGRLRVPTLVVWGVNDPLAPFPAGLALFDLICGSVPAARLHVFNQSGHFPYREYPDEFNALVRDFVSRAPSLSAAGAPPSASAPSAP